MAAAAAASSVAGRRADGQNSSKERDSWYTREIKMRTFKPD